LRAMLVNKLKVGVMTCLAFVAAVATSVFVREAPARQSVSWNSQNQ
jgi:hypothetical protein